MEPSLLQLYRICKSFPGVQALSQVDFNVYPGMVHALVGENGAGKSTLIKILAGVHLPDSGEILLDARPVRIADPVISRSMGIAVIHQELDLFPDLSVTENLFLGRGLSKGPGGFIRWGETYRRAAGLFSRLGEPLAPETMGRDLSPAQRQMAQIAAVLAQQARIVVMDEPTASLTEREVHVLFDQVRRLKESGVGIVYVTHRLDEVFAIADEVTVLRDGWRILSVQTSETSKDEIIRAMVGREVSAFFPKEETRPGEPALVIRNLTDRASAFRSVSFEIRKSEIVGLYGLVGAGRSQLGQAIVGLRGGVGEIGVAGTKAFFRSPAEALRAGVVYVPEDRLVQGLFYGLSVRENMTIAVLREISRAGFVDQGAERRLVGEQIRVLDIRTRDPNQIASTLSGGNQQKVVLGRWLLAQPKVLILDEPTRGVDVGAKAEIHRLMSRLATQGIAILLISSELPEVLGMSRRILVMREGNLVAEFARDQASEEVIGGSAFPEERHRTQRIDQAMRQAQEPAHHVSVRRRRTAAERPTSRDALARLAHRRETVLALFLLVLIPLLGAFTPGFATVENLRHILTNICVLTVASVGMTLVILAGGIDISVGSILAVSATSAALLAKEGWGLLPTLLIGIIAGGLLGLINGGISVLGRVHPIIVTLGTMGIYRGAIILVTRGRWVTTIPESLTGFSQGDWFSIPKPVWTVGLVILGASFALKYFEPGRMVYATGSNPRAARLVGIHTGKVLVWTFLLCGLFTGLGGAIYAGRYGEVQTNTGIGFELRVIAATVIGGTNIMGGSGSVFGSLLGAFLLGVISNAMVLLHISSYWEGVAVGLFILGAVVLDTVRQQRRVGS